MSKTYIGAARSTQPKTALLSQTAFLSPLRTPKVLLPPHLRTSKYSVKTSAPGKFDLKVIQKFIEKDIERKLSPKQKIQLKKLKMLTDSMEASKKAHRRVVSMEALPQMEEMISPNEVVGGGKEKKVKF